MCVIPTPGATQALKLDKLKQGVEASHEHILRILRQFGLIRVDLTQIRNMIKATAGPRRKLLASRAEQLGKLAQVYQKLVGERKELESKIGTEAQKAEIAVADTAFPGVTVRIGERQRKLEEAVKAPRFRIVEGKLVER